MSKRTIAITFAALLAGSLGAIAQTTLPNVTAVPTWNYTTTSDKDGANYSVTLAGRSPLTRPHSVTVIQVNVVPVVLTATDGTVFDPAVRNPCTGVSPLEKALASPVFASTPFTIGGAYMGNTQYMDAYQRANFWQRLPAKNSYRVLLAPVVLAPLNISISAGVRSENCSGAPGTVKVATPNKVTLTSLIEEAMTSGQGPKVAPDSFVYFLMGEVAPVGGAGWHGAYHTGQRIVDGNGQPQAAVVQTYGASGLPAGTGANVGYVFSHEVAEWFMDPLVSNRVPAWTVPSSYPSSPELETLLEVADPVNGSAFPDIVMANGVTYNPSELVFLSWFFHNSSIAVNGMFSTQGTKTSRAP